MDCSPPGFSVHGILRQKYWSGLQFPTSGDLPDRDWTQISCTAERFSTIWATREAQYKRKNTNLFMSQVPADHKKSSNRFWWVGKRRDLYLNRPGRRATSIGNIRKIILELDFEWPFKSIRKIWIYPTDSGKPLRILYHRSDRRRQRAGVGKWARRDRGRKQT